MSIHEQARYIFDRLTEYDLQLFVALFGRLCLKDQQTDTPEIKAFRELNEIIESIPPFQPDLDEKNALDIVNDINFRTLT